jgi:hypothetical protein
MTMLTIYKFALQEAGWQIISIRSGARVISVAEQNNQIVLYAILDTNAPTVFRKVSVVGTGHTLSEEVASWQSVGTVKLHGGTLMFHVFVSDEDDHDPS